MIKTGRYGKVSYDPAGGSALVPILSLNAWKLSTKTDYEDVSCFGDSPNKVYIPGLMDLGGSFAGYFNAEDLTLFKAAMQPTPGMLALMPNTTETAVWQGLAYMSADIDCSMNAPKVSGEFKAGGSWTVPGMIAATGAAGGTGVGSFTPPGATAPANLAALAGVTASPATAWPAGSFVLLGDGSKAHWTGSAWAAGPA